MKINKTSTHNYELPVYTIDHTGLVQTDGIFNINLLRGSKVTEENTIPKQDGILSEQLLQVVLTYLKDVNIGKMETKETSNAIDKIEEALMWIDLRRENRANRGVLSSYKK